MAAVLCPLYSEPFYSYTIDLSDEAYTLTFRWNGRSNQWFMSIDDSEENNIMKSVALVPFFPLLSQYSLNKPEGEFLLLTPSGEGPENASIPDPRNIHQTHYLIYTDDN